jgi:hypothetical protein
MRDELSLALLFRVPKVQSSNVENSILITTVE